MLLQVKNLNVVLGGLQILLMLYWVDCKFCRGSTFMLMKVSL